MFTGFMKNLELLLSLKGELTEKKEQSQIQLTATIEKKKMKQRYLDLISGALISFCDEQQRKKVENQASITELTSLLNEVQDDETLSQQLLSLLHGLSKDSAMIFRQKMDEKMFAPLADKMKAAALEDAELMEHLKEIKFIGPDGNPSTDWPEDVNLLAPRQRDVLLVSHLTLALKNRVVTAVNKCKGPTSTTVTPSLSKLGNASTSTASAQQFQFSAGGNSREKRSTTTPQVIQASSLKVEPPSAKKRRTVENQEASAPRLICNIFRDFSILNDAIRIDMCASSSYSPLINKLVEFTPTFNSTQKEFFKHQSVTIAEVNTIYLFLLIRQKIILCC